MCAHVQAPGILCVRLDCSFFLAGALSVVVEDADRGTEIEQPIFDEPGEIGSWSRCNGMECVFSVLFFDSIFCLFNAFLVGWARRMAKE